MENAIQIVCETKLDDILDEIEREDEDDQIKDRASQFLHSLTYCTPMFAGFLQDTVLLFAEMNTKCCLCPLDKRLNFWRDFCDLKDLFLSVDCEFEEEGCCTSGLQTPEGLIAHIRQRADKGCRAHRITLAFLEEVFKTYHKTTKGEFRHIAFEKVNDKNYQRTKRHLLMDVAGYIKKLEEENRALRNDTEAKKGSDK